RLPPVAIGLRTNDAAFSHATASGKSPGIGTSRSAPEATSTSTTRYAALSVCPITAMTRPSADHAGRLLDLEGWYTPLNAAGRRRVATVRSWPPSRSATTSAVVLSLIRTNARRCPSGDHPIAL